MTKSEREREKERESVRASEEPEVTKREAASSAWCDKECVQRFMTERERERGRGCVQRFMTKS